MRITDARVIVCSPGRNFVTLKIVTEDGVHGLGDATLNGRELAVASYLQDHVAPLLIGRDARRIEDTWQYLYKGAYWRRGPVTMTAISAVDTALWDILGKSTNRPVYQLLGGASRESAMVYGHANGTTIDETVAAVGRYVEMGYKAVRAQCAIPGCSRTRTASDGGTCITSLRNAAGRRKRHGAPSGTCSSFLPCSNGCAGNSARICTCSMTSTTVSRRWKQGGSARRSNRTICSGWRIPSPPSCRKAFGLIRQHTTTPIAVGEVFDTIYDCHRLISEQLIDYIRMTVVRGGGISHLRKIAHLAELYHVRTGSHGATDLSPGVHGGRASSRPQRP